MGYSDIKELLKDAKDIASGANDLQLKGLLLDIQGMVYDLQEENRELREENTELKNKEIIKSELYKDGRMWCRKGEDYKYCPRCYGENEKLISCDIMNGMMGDGYLCPVCEKFFII